MRRKHQSDFDTEGPQPRLQHQWHELANRIRNIIYADNGLNPWGTDVDIALRNWAIKQYPASMDTIAGNRAAMSVYLSTNRQRYTAGDITEAMTILARYHGSPPGPRKQIDFQPSFGS